MLILVFSQDTRRLKLQDTFPSVNAMLVGMEEMLMETPEADLPQTEWWKCLIQKS